MNGWFALDGDSVAQRARTAGKVIKPLSLMESLVIGWMGFGLVSTVAFASVAWGERWLYQHLGRVGAYVLWTVLFIVGAAPVLGRLVAGPGNQFRFYRAFAVAFLLYAAAYVAAFFGLRAAGFRSAYGEALGLAAGSAVMAWVLCAAFGAQKSLREVTLVLGAGSLAGYFVGRIVFASQSGRGGMVSWGVIYGVCFGFALGYALYLCQSRVRELFPASE